MAASSKFDLSSSSSDRPAHPNVQRVSHAHVSLERSGSFRRASENPGLTSPAPRGPLSSQADVGNFVQNLLNEMPTAVLETSSSRTGEVRRSISSIIGVSQNDSLNSTSNVRPLPLSSFEEIRRLKSNLIEGSIKARDRAKAFSEAALKMKRCSNSMPKRRPRTDISSVERAIPASTVGSTSVVGTHSHFSARSFQNGPQKQERTKNGMQKRKLGTSFIDEGIDGRPSKMVRPSSAMERDKDVLRLAYSSATPPEEKCRALPTKRKRSSIKSDISSNAVLSRPHDGEGEASKRGLQQKLATDARSRLTNTHGFRANGSEESYAASPTASMKMNGSARGPRPVLKTSSPSTNHAAENSDGWEHANSKLNRKRSVSACAPQLQWCEPKIKKARAGRRSNLPPVVSSRDEYTSSDTLSPSVNDENMGNMGRPCNSASQSKPINDLALSDCDDHFAVENKPMDNIKRGSDIGERTCKAAMAAVPFRKNKMVNEEDKKLRKASRGAAPSRSGVLNEKFDSVVTAKQIRTSGVIDEKVESKTGRPLTKKLSDRKGHSRPRHPDTPPSEFAGESDDDQEELLAAANAALDSVRHACLPPQPPKSHDQKSFSGKGRTKLRSFWEQNEDYFAFLSIEDQAFFDRQINLSDEVKSAFDSGDHRNLKGGHEYNLLLPTPKRASQNLYDGSSNGTLTTGEHTKSDQSKYMEPFLEDSVLSNGVQTGISISQLLLSAIIDENEIESLGRKINIEEDQSYKSAYELSFGNKPTSDSSKADDGWNYYDDFTLKNLETTDFMDDLVSSLTTSSLQTCTEFQYAQMSMDERILLELNEIGVFPEILPCLAQSEGEDIDAEINRLMGEYQEQVSKRKTMLLKLEKAVKEARESQGRELEQIALDKLVERAYEKYMACWGPKPSGSKNSSRAIKQATLGFITRTLERWKKYKETGTSCFSEPPFREMFYSVSSRKDISRNADRNSESIMTNGTEDQWSNKLKQKELLLDEVIGSATDILRVPSSLSNTVKGKRSERDREGKGKNTKTGRTSSSNAKGERKNKSKPKQKMTSVKGLGSSTESPKTVSPSPSTEPKHSNEDNSKRDDELGPVSDLLGEPNFANDFGDFGGVFDDGQGGQDINSWLNIELDNMHDTDFMGLEIPMDDLSEVF